jgi:hypothetical protein
LRCAHSTWAMVTAHETWAMIVHSTFPTEGSSICRHAGCAIPRRRFPHHLTIRVPARRPKGQQRGRFGEIFKVQVAQGAPPGSPMLMYNKERTRKTFIHSSAPGYSEIKDAVRVPLFPPQRVYLVCGRVCGCVCVRACVRASER